MSKKGVRWKPLMSREVGVVRVPESSGKKHWDILWVRDLLGLVFSSSYKCRLKLYRLLQLHQDYTRQRSL